MLVITKFQSNFWETERTILIFTVTLLCINHNFQLHGIKYKYDYINI